MGFASFISETDDLPFFAGIYLKIFGIPVLGARQRYKLIHSLLKINKNECVLDLGIGGGLNAISLMREGFQVIGTDISKVGVKKASKRARKLNLPSEFVLADGAYIPFKSETFDKILCTEVLEHILNDKMAMGEISMVLKKHGKACISTPLGNPDVIHPSSQRKYHVREGYTVKYLESFSKEYGLELEKTVYFERRLVRIAKNIYFKVKSLCKSGEVFYPEYNRKKPLLAWVYTYFILSSLFPLLDIVYRIDAYTRGEASSIMLLLRKEGAI